MTLTYDAIVVGGGIVGAATAYHLRLAGIKTLLIDRYDAGRATSAGAGILAPEINRRDPKAWFDFAVVAVDYYPHLVAALQAENAGETSYARCGIMLVAATDDEIPAFEQAQTEILARREQRGTPAPQELHAISPGEARELFPALAQVQRAFYYRQAARVDGRQMAQALLQAAQQRGLQVMEGSVTRLLLEGNRVTGVAINGEEISAGMTIIAGGAWTPALTAPLGVQVPIVPQRGQIAHLELTGQHTGDWPIVNAFHGHYIVPWPDGRVAVGATREVGSGFAPVTSAAGIREVMDEALRVAPGLSSAKLLEIRVGLRPMPPDGLPILGKVPGTEGILLATGHGPTGLQLGPYSGKVIAELVQGQSPSVDIHPFRVERFG